jgi:hypothetical protein
LETLLHLSTPSNLTCPVSVINYSQAPYNLAYGFGYDTGCSITHAHVYFTCLSSILSTQLFYSFVLYLPLPGTITDGWHTFFVTHTLKGVAGGCSNEVGGTTSSVTLPVITCHSRILLFLALLDFDIFMLSNTLTLLFSFFFFITFSGGDDKDSFLRGE